MSQLLARIQAAQLDNRKAAISLKSEPQKSRAKLLTYFIGELERVYKLEDITDKEVIAKLKNVSDSLLDEKEQEYLRSFLPQTYSQEWHESYILDCLSKGFAEVKDVQKRVRQHEADGEFEYIVDRGLLNKILQQKTQK